MAMMNSTKACPSSCCQRSAAPIKAMDAPFSMTSTPSRIMIKLRRAVAQIIPSATTIPARASTYPKGMPIALLFAFLCGALADEQCADQGHQQQQRGDFHSQPAALENVGSEFGRLGAGSRQGDPG